MNNSSDRQAKISVFHIQPIFCNQCLRIPSFWTLFYRHGGVPHDDPVPVRPGTTTASVKQLTVASAAAHLPFSTARSPLRLPATEVEDAKERGCSVWWTEDAVKLTQSPPSLAASLWRPGYGDGDDSWPSGAAVRNSAEDNVGHWTRPLAHEAACCRHQMRCRNATWEPLDAQLVVDMRGATAGGATTTDGTTGAIKETRSVQTQTSLRNENGRKFKVSFVLEIFFFLTRSFFY
jgi:hypothetical protein